ncbi:MAG: class I SAM-dependent methyltransferase [Deltaproteobacteria bacterium]|nr:class I SAM-dependent methyltransferase [Deltaproteobacteria bacterium]
MPSVTEHYENVLAGHYSWLFGGIDAKVAEHRQFFQAQGITPLSNGLAIDLGCGSGFQSLPLAQLGFRVLAVDLSPTLLAELASGKGDLQIETIQDDLLEFPQYLSGRAELCVCMGDTLTHLDSRQTIAQLFQRVAEHLEPGGKFILTFRDLSLELTELDRFLPLRSEPDKIFTCYLEYEPEHVKVHDLLYERVGEQWLLHKSFYRKCRVSFTWAKDTLQTVGFALAMATLDKGLVTIIAQKR